MTLGRFLAWFAVSFLATVALLVGLVWLAAWKLSIPVGPQEASQGRAYTAETWRQYEREAEGRVAGQDARKAVPGAEKARKTLRKAEKAPSEPGTVKEARRWSKCAGPACYHDVRQEAAPFLNQGL